MKNYQISRPLCYFIWFLGKEKLTILVTNSELYLVLWTIYSTQGTEKTLFTLLWNVIGGRVGYQAWQNICCVWLKLVCHKCLWQSGIWTNFDEELCYPTPPCILHHRYPLWLGISSMSLRGCCTTPPFWLDGCALEPTAQSRRNDIDIWALFFYC